jgi:hypothetical protein
VTATICIQVPISDKLCPDTKSLKFLWLKERKAN